MASQSVILTRAALMQSVADAVRVGYYYWVSGSVTADRAAAWVRKATRYYAVDLDRHRRARAKAAGEGCARLFVHEESPGTLVWLLCCTNGDHPAHRLERLTDARISGPTLSGCELVRLTRPGSPSPAWTWRMTRETFAARRAEAIDVVRRGDACRIRQFVHSLYTAPGFAGLRRQTGKIVALFRSEWKRRRGRQPLPYLPSRLWYVQRMRVESVPLHVWLAAHARLRSKAMASSESGRGDKRSVALLPEPLIGDDHGSKQEK